MPTSSRYVPVLISPHPKLQTLSARHRCTLDSQHIRLPLMASESRPPLPPFTEETAKTKVKAAQDAWNTR